MSCVLTLAYLCARDTYRVEREEKSGKGYADFTFHPRRKNDTAFIVELKKDENVDVAINQIKSKEYVKSLKKKIRIKKYWQLLYAITPRKKSINAKLKKFKLATESLA